MYERSPVTLHRSSIIVETQFHVNGFRAIRACAASWEKRWGMPTMIGSAGVKIGLKVGSLTIRLLDHITDTNRVPLSTVKVSKIDAQLLPHRDIPCTTLRLCISDALTISAPGSYSWKCWNRLLRSLQHCPGFELHSSTSFYIRTCVFTNRILSVLFPLESPHAWG